MGTANVKFIALPLRPMIKLTWMMKEWNIPKPVVLVVIGMLMAMHIHSLETAIHSGQYLVASN